MPFVGMAGVCFYTLCTSGRHTILDVVSVMSVVLYPRRTMNCVYIYPTRPHQSIIRNGYCKLLYVACSPHSVIAPEN